MFLIYVNDLSDDLRCTLKLFANDTSLFSTVRNINEATRYLNKDLIEIMEWAFQWKIGFNPDISKLAHEIIFARKRTIIFHPSLTFNDIPSAQTCSREHGIILDNKLNFEENLNKVIPKINKKIGVIHNLQNVLPRLALLAIYISSIRPHLD